MNACVVGARDGLCVRSSPDRVETGRCALKRPVVASEVQEVTCWRARLSNARFCRFQGGDDDPYRTISHRLGRAIRLRTASHENDRTVPPWPGAAEIGGTSKCSAVPNTWQLPGRAGPVARPFKENREDTRVRADYGLSVRAAGL